MNDSSDDRLRARTAVRDLAIGLGSAALALWLFFFATVATVEIAMLISVTAAFIWFATTATERLVDPSTGRPSAMLFGLAAVGLTFLVTGLLFVGSLTSYLTAALGIAAIVIGLTRIYSKRPPMRNV